MLEWLIGRRKGSSFSVAPLFAVEAVQPTRRAAERAHRSLIRNRAETLELMCGADQREALSEAGNMFFNCYMMAVYLESGLARQAMGHAGLHEDIWE